MRGKLMYRQTILNADETQRLVSTKLAYRRYCNCGCSVYIFPFENRTRKLCKNCGKYIYISPEEEFKDKLITAIRKVSKQ